jgi:release factor glutamine methyltransferase
LYFEINQAYGRETVDMLRDMGYGNVELKRDINGKDRMVKSVI